MRVRNGDHCLRSPHGRSGSFSRFSPEACSIVLTQGPPKPGESDYDPTGAYPGGVPCTSSRMWPLVDAAFLLWALALTVTYEDRDDQIDGSLTSAAAAISTWIGYRRTNACRDAQAVAMPGTPPTG